jgi:hypothetical protein
MGVLPRILRTLVERRRQVKSLIAQADKNSPELVQVGRSNPILGFERFLADRPSSNATAPYLPFL